MEFPPKNIEWTPIEEFNYVDGKFKRPHIKLKDGSIMYFCFLDAGIFKGRDNEFNYRIASYRSVAEFSLNRYEHYIQFIQEFREELYSEPKEL